jgi:hypothetical protein
LEIRKLGELTSSLCGGGGGGFRVRDALKMSKAKACQKPIYPFAHSETKVTGKALGWGCSQNKGTKKRCR